MKTNHKVYIVHLYEAFDRRVRNRGSHTVCGISFLTCSDRIKSWSSHSNATCKRCLRSQAAQIAAAKP